MELEDIYNDMADDLERARIEMKKAEELIALGVDMNIDVSDLRRKVRDIERDINTYEKAVSKRRNNGDSSPPPTVD